MLYSDRCKKCFPLRVLYNGLRKNVYVFTFFTMTSVKNVCPSAFFTMTFVKDVYPSACFTMTSAFIAKAYVFVATALLQPWPRFKTVARLYQQNAAKKPETINQKPETDVTLPPKHCYIEHEH